jgi:Ca2+-binding EF-hand superfamily protein
MMLRVADANKDGAVTEAEFLDAHAKHFAMLDTNKDGSVTAQERRAAMTKMRDHMKQMRGGKHDGMKHGEGHEHPAGA